MQKKNTRDVNGVKERSSNNLLYSAKLLRKFQIVINSGCKNFIAKIVSICNINRQHIANNNKFIPKLEHSNVMTGQIHAFKLSLRQSFAWGQGILLRINKLRQNEVPIIKF